MSETNSVSSEPIPQPTSPPIPPAPAASSNGKKWLFVVSGLVAAVAILWFGFNLLRTNSGQVLGAVSDYQAVFLSNGQVYFGKMTSTVDWIVLKDVYYLQATQELQPTSNTKKGDETNAQQPNIQLVKLGNELHGPDDAMYVDKDKVLFWENMKEDSKVVAAIRKHQASKQPVK